MIKRLFALTLPLLFLISCSNNSKRVSSDDFIEEWPFTIENGSVQCLDGYVVVFNANGKTYALNDAAKVTGDFENITEITRLDTNYPGRKIHMDISLVEFEGLRLCERQ